MTRRIFGILGFVSLLVSGCAGAPAEKAEVAANLPPMAQPERAVGYTWTGLRDGQDFSMTIVSDGGDSWNWETSTGCKFTISKKGFAPALKSSNCERAELWQTVAQSGGIWPLEVGKSWSFAFSGSNSVGHSWKGKRNCEVVSTVKAQTALGPTDAYKVICRDKWNEHTFYYSPTMKELVLWEWYVKDRKRKFKHEIAAAS